jgi:hypothetical protein
MPDKLKRSRAERPEKLENGLQMDYFKSDQLSLQNPAFRGE